MFGSFVLFSFQKISNDFRWRAEPALEFDLFFALQVTSRGKPNAETSCADQEAFATLHQCIDEGELIN